MAGVGSIITVVDAVLVLISIPPVCQLARLAIQASNIISLHEEYAKLHVPQTPSNGFLEPVPGQQLEEQALEQRQTPANLTEASPEFHH